MTRLPNDYELKQTTIWGNYFKITDEPQEFRILTSPIIWYEYFKEEDWKIKPVRKKEKEVEFEIVWWFMKLPAIPKDSKDWLRPKEFRAFVVWNHWLKKIQIMELTQKTIMKSIVELTKSVDWSDPKQYDMSIVKSWKGKETKYSITPLPKSRFESDEEWNKALEEAEWVRLEALYDWDDPFNPF